MSLPHRNYTKRITAVAQAHGVASARNHWRRFVCLSLVMVCAVIGACGSIASRQRGERRGETDTDEFLLTVTPFENPVAVTALLRVKDESEVVRYSPAQLTVLDVRRGRLPEELLARLRAKADAPSFQSALSRGDFGSTGFEEGDLFQLTLQPEGLATTGLLHKAPQVIQEFIKDLLSLEGQLGKAQPAEAYLRSERIDRQRLDALRRGGKIRFIPLDDFPADFRPALTKAIEHPLRFHPLTRSQYDRLLTLSSHGPELFTIVGDAGHQLTLYHARP